MGCIHWCEAVLIQGSSDSALSDDGLKQALVAARDVAVWLSKLKAPISEE